MKLLVPLDLLDVNYSFDFEYSIEDSKLKFNENNSPIITIEIANKALELVKLNETNCIRHPG